MTDAALVVALANAQAFRRPTHARAAVRDDAFADAHRATALLGPFLDEPVAARQLPALRALQRAVAAIVDALIDGSTPPLEALNALAAREPAINLLEPAPHGGLRSALRPKRASVAAALVHHAISELGALDATRLRRCARPECALVFYDMTRSATRRWHAERPCGLRERQRRHRDRRAT